MNLQDYAIYYATAYGWYLFPVVPREKRPATTNGFKDATNDPDAIAAVWERGEYNIGVDCGRSGLAVVDVDAEGMDAWNTIADKMQYRGAMVQYTGGGGVHVIYRQPALVEIRNTAGKLAPHIDTRGEGGYILLAPSIHPSGRAYAWEEMQCDFDAMETFPPELIPLLKDKPTLSPASSIQPPANPSRVLQRSYERIANTPEGGRNQTINKAAWYLFGLVREGHLNESDVTQTILAAASRCGYPERETMAVLQSVRANR